MNRGPFVSAIDNALIEIQKAYPDITHSFLFTNKGSIITHDTNFDETNIQKMLDSFNQLKEKTNTIGKLKNLTINGKNGKIKVSSIDDMYFGLITTDKVEESQIHFIANAIIPPLIKTFQTFSPSNFPQKVPSHLQSPFTKTLFVDPLHGFFDGKAVQIDEQTLKDWNKTNKFTKSIKKVKIETANGNFKICKVKKIKSKKFQGKDRVRIPEKICDMLSLKKGDEVNITPKL